MFKNGQTLVTCPILSLKQNILRLCVQFLDINFQHVQLLINLLDMLLLYVQFLYYNCKHVHKMIKKWTY